MGLFNFNREQPNVNKEQPSVNDVLNNNLYKIIDLSEAAGKKNVIISGLSLKIAFAMLLNGSTGECEKELIAFLGQNRDKLNIDTQNALKECGENLKMANAFWFNIPNKVNPNYAQIIKEFQDAEIQVDDFDDPKTLEKINGWVSERTNELIPELLAKLDSSTISLLINTLYFKAQWSNPMSELSTHDDVFHGLDGDTTIKMMKAASKQYFENSVAKGFSLYYENSPYEFIAVLPNNEGDFKISDLDLNHFDRVTGNYAVDADFPKLDLEFDINLANLLKGNIIPAPFDPAHSFELASMLNGPQYVTDVIHKTKFKLDEKGTEAAAATVIIMARSASMNPVEPTRIKLTFNRPFAFMIRHKLTKDLLFVGKITDLLK